MLDNAVQDRFAIEIVPQVGDALFDYRLGSLAGCAALVRLENHISQPKQTFRDIRLVLKDIEARAAPPIIEERIDERRFIDDGSSSNVDQKTFRPQCVQY